MAMPFSFLEHLKKYSRNRDLKHSLSSKRKMQRNHFLMAHSPSYCECFISYKNSINYLEKMPQFELHW